MADSMELGGNIVLTGFGEVEPGKLVVIKKIVGTYAKEISEKLSNFEKLEMILSEDESLKAIVTAGGTATEAQAGEKNLFFGLDKVLKEVVSKIT